MFRPSMAIIRLYMKTSSIYTLDHRSSVWMGWVGGYIARSRLGLGCAKFPKFTPAWNSTCFGQFLCPSRGHKIIHFHIWELLPIFWANSTPISKFWNFYSFLESTPISTFWGLGPSPTHPCLNIASPNSNLEAVELRRRRTVVAPWKITFFKSKQKTTSSAHRTTNVPSWSCSKTFFKPVWHIPLLSVQWINSWWWAEEQTEACRVSCQSKFGKLVHLFGCITKRQPTGIYTVHGRWMKCQYGALVGMIMTRKSSNIVRKNSPSVILSTTFST